MTDVEQIIAWLEMQAAKERELLDSADCRPDAKERATERWIVYKASAQCIRTGAWKQYVFTKSGSLVTIVGAPRAVVPGRAESEMVNVRRVDTGKEMLVPRSALVPRWEAE